MDNLTYLAEEVYTYQQSNGYWDSQTADLPLEELQAELDCLDSFWDAEEFDETELRDTIRQTINLADDIKENHFYKHEYNEPCIQLSDNHTLWEINADISEEEYDCFVLEAISAFKEQTHTDLYCLGRRGRHICVANTYENAIRFDELCKVQKTLENNLIEEINNSPLFQKNEKENKEQRQPSEER